MNADCLSIFCIHPQPLRDRKAHRQIERETDHPEETHRHTVTETATKHKNTEGSRPDTRQTNIARTDRAQTDKRTRPSQSPYGVGGVGRRPLLAYAPIVGIEEI